MHPLPIPDHPWQYITIDFKLMLASKNGYNCVFIVINRLSKQAILTPCHKTINAEEMAHIYLRTIYRYYSPPETIISNRGP